MTGVDPKNRTQKSLTGCQAFFYPMERKTSPFRVRIESTGMSHSSNEVFVVAQYIV